MRSSELDALEARLRNRAAIRRAFNDDGDSDPEADADIATADAIAALRRGPVSAEDIKALRLAIGYMPSKNAPCHVGICTQEKCGLCSRTRAALDVVARLAAHREER